MDNTITVELTSALDRHPVYSRTATCREWKNASATFIIEQDGDTFIVTDSLPED